MSSKISQWAPIALFIYKRPEHARRTIASLKACLSYHESRLLAWWYAPDVAGRDRKAPARRQSCALHPFTKSGNAGLAFG